MFQFLDSVYSFSTFQVGRKQHSDYCGKRARRSCTTIMNIQRGYRGDRRSITIARQEELRMLVNNYDDIPLEDYIGYVVVFYN